MNVVSLVSEYSFVAVDETDFRFAGNDVFKSRFHRSLLGNFQVNGKAAILLIYRSGFYLDFGPTPNLQSLCSGTLVQSELN